MGVRNVGPDEVVACWCPLIYGSAHPAFSGGSGGGAEVLLAVKVEDAVAVYVALVVT